MFVLALQSPPAWATQDELDLPWDTRDALFSEDAADVVRALNGAIGMIDLGAYPTGTGHHNWHGNVLGDVALLTWRDLLVWHASLEVQTVADDGNDINFRLVRLFYRFRVAVDLRLGPGVLWAGLSHRCSHGTDGALPGRILIRSGFDAGYRVALRWGDLELGLKATAQGTILGQNTDLTTQVRGILAGAAQLTYALPADFRVFAGAGIGVGLVGASPSDIYLLSDAAEGLRGEPLPVAVVGAAYDGLGASLTVMLHYQRTLDTGLTEVSQPASLLAIRIRFGW